MNEYELYHYGVKGMKWGVRRAIGKQARSYAKDHYAKKNLTAKSNKIDSRIKKSQEKIEKLKREKSSVHNKISELDSMMKQKASGLSQKDIAQGKREFVAGKIAKYAAAASLYAASAYVGSNATTHTVMMSLGRYAMDGPPIHMTSKQFADFISKAR